MDSEKPYQPTKEEVKKAEEMMDGIESEPVAKDINSEFLNLEE